MIKLPLEQRAQPALLAAFVSKSKEKHETSSTCAHHRALKCRAPQHRNRPPARSFRGNSCFGDIAGWPHCLGFAGWHSTKTEVARFNHEAKVAALAVSPNGNLASLCEHKNRKIRIWDTRSQTELIAFDSGLWVNALTVLPNGNLALGSTDIIQLWDITNGLEVARFTDLADGIDSIAVWPEGHLATGNFSGTYDRTIRLWKLTTGKVTSRLKGHTDGVTALAQLQDGSLASGSIDHTIRLWGGGSLSSTLDGHTGPVAALAGLPGNRLVSGSYDRTVRLWDVQRLTQIASFECDISGTNSLASMGDGRLVVSCMDKSIRVWALA